MKKVSSYAETRCVNLLESIIYFLFGLTDTVEDVGQAVSEEKELLRGLLFSAGHMIFLRARLDGYSAKKAAAVP